MPGSAKGRVEHKTNPNGPPPGAGWIRFAVQLGYGCLISQKRLPQVNLFSSQIQIKLHRNTLLFFSKQKS